MSDTRTQIFARLKETLDAKRNPTLRFSEADQRIKEAPRSTIPKRGLSRGSARVEMFVDEAEKVSAQIVRLDSLGQVPQALRELAKERPVKVAPHETLKALDWSGLEVRFGTGEAQDTVGVSMAYAGAAETGTLVLRSNEDSPTTLNFLPDIHVVVLQAGDLEANYEDVWARLRQDGHGRASVLPRTVNWITGPSRTADIEQTLLLGAHGPRKLVILLVDEKA